MVFGGVLVYSDCESEIVMTTMVMWYYNFAFAFADCRTPRHIKLRLMIIKLAGHTLRTPSSFVANIMLPFVLSFPLMNAF